MSYKLNGTNSDMVDVDFPPHGLPDAGFAKPECANPWDGKLKQVAGIWLPKEESHLDGFLLNSPKHRGAGTYQNDTLMKAISLVPEDRRGHALDIGSHCGIWARSMADYFDYVSAFEPIPAHIECWHRNVPQENATLYEIALGDFEGQVSMNWKANNTGNSSVSADGTGNVIVDQYRLDDLEIDDWTFGKLDCEGYEYYCLKGAEISIIRNKPILVVEQKDHKFFDIDRYAAIEYLKNLGMREIGRVRDDYIMGWK